MTPVTESDEKSDSFLEQKKPQQVFDPVARESSINRSIVVEQAQQEIDVENLLPIETIEEEANEIFEPHRNSDSKPDDEPEEEEGADTVTGLLDNVGLI